MDTSVIAIHGIGADAGETWKTNGVNWLKHPEMLPDTAPTARTMPFGWESKWICGGSIDQRFFTVADQLLDSLRTVRMVLDV